MRGFIDEIIEEAAESTTPVSTLLRKAKIAAAALELDNLEEWISSELNGYEGEVPDYRKITGELKGFNPVRGWIPIFSDDPDFIRPLTEVDHRQKIAELESLLSAESGDIIHIPLPPHIVSSINELMYVPIPQMSVFFQLRIFMELSMP